MQIKVFLSSSYTEEMLINRDLFRAELLTRFNIISGQISVLELEILTALFVHPERSIFFIQELPERDREMIRLLGFLREHSHNLYPFSERYELTELTLQEFSTHGDMASAGKTVAVADWVRKNQGRENLEVFSRFQEVDAGIFPLLCYICWNSQADLQINVSIRRTVFSCFIKR